jgi:hypothetical protein
MAWFDRETKRLLKHIGGNYAVVFLILVIAVVLDLFERICAHWGVLPFICAGMTILSRFLFVLDVLAASGISVLSMYHWFKKKF